jgi:hypothetical protein
LNPRNKKLHVVQNTNPYALIAMLDCGTNMNIMNVSNTGDPIKNKKMETPRIFH